MTYEDMVAVHRNHVDFVHGGAAWDAEFQRMTVDVGSKPPEVQVRLCDGLAQSLGRAGWNLDVWLEDGVIYVADKETVE